MFALVVTGPGVQIAERIAFAGHEATIGRVDGNHLVLHQHEVSKRHARMVAKDGKYIIVDLKSTNGTFVNGRRITAPLVVRDGDTIKICDYTLALSNVDVDTLAGRVRQRFVASDPTEERLLAEIAGGDDAARAVYADWLEEHGELQRAEFLRVQQELVAMSPRADGFEMRSGRLGALATAIDIAWRTVVARPTIERCRVAFDFRCPKEWGSLAPTKYDGVRSCGACNSLVYYAASVVDAREIAARGDCVALDVTSARWTHDLGEPFAERWCRRCKLDVGHGPQHCPRCAHRIDETELVLGRMA